ncbi:MAG: ATP-binding protein [Actinomycetes bacterium]
MSKFRARIDLPATLQAPRAARDVVGRLLAVWGPGLRGSAEIGDAALLVTSELVTNAVEHARPSHTLELEIDIDVEDAELVIALSDGSALRPVARELTDSSERGRGIALVEALAQEWGVEDRHPGKRVWVRLVG